MSMMVWNVPQFRRPKKPNTVTIYLTAGSPTACISVENSTVGLVPEYRTNIGLCAIATLFHVPS